MYCGSLSVVAKAETVNHLTAGKTALFFNNAHMEDLKQLLGQLLEVQIQQARLQQEMAARLDRLAKRMERDQKSFLDPDEACEALGIRLNKSGTHRRRLRWLRENGLLTRFGSQNPFTYDAEQVHMLAEKIRAGKVMVPAA